MYLSCKIPLLYVPFIPPLKRYWESNMGPWGKARLLTPCITTNLKQGGHSRNLRAISEEVCVWGRKASQRIAGSLAVQAPSLTRLLSLNNLLWKDLAWLYMPFESAVSDLACLWLPSTFGFCHYQTWFHACLQLPPPSSLSQTIAFLYLSHCCLPLAWFLTSEVGVFGLSPSRPWQNHCVISQRILILGTAFIFIQKCNWDFQAASKKLFPIDKSIF